MIYLTEKERVTLAVLGTMALVGVGVTLWLQRWDPIRIESGPTPPYAQWDAQLQRARQVDLNHATAEELVRLPGIGPTLAKRIVDYRAQHGPFEAAEDLRHVAGIGPKTFAVLQDNVTAHSTTTGEE